MTPDYSDRYYRSVSMNRKRQVIDAVLEDLQQQYFSMIEQALAQSNMQQSQEVIDYIRSL
jgi:hypothetical protein